MSETGVNVSKRKLERKPVTVNPLELFGPLQPQQQQQQPQPQQQQQQQQQQPQSQQQQQQPQQQPQPQPQPQPQQQQQQQQQQQPQPQQQQQQPQQQPQPQQQQPPQQQQQPSPPQPPPQQQPQDQPQSEPQQQPQIEIKTPPVSEQKPQPVPTPSQPLVLGKRRTPLDPTHGTPPNNPPPSTRKATTLLSNPALGQQEERFLAEERKRREEEQADLQLQQQAALEEDLAKQGADAKEEELKRQAENAKREEVERQRALEKQRRQEEKRRIRTEKEAKEREILENAQRDEERRVAEEKERRDRQTRALSQIDSQVKIVMSQTRAVDAEQGRLTTQASHILGALEAPETRYLIEIGKTIEKIIVQFNDGENKWRADYATNVEPHWKMLFDQLTNKSKIPRMDFKLTLEKDQKYAEACNKEIENADNVIQTATDTVVTQLQTLVIGLNLGRTGNENMQSFLSDPPPLGSDSKSPFLLSQTKVRDSVRQFNEAVKKLQEVPSRREMKSSIFYVGEVAREVANWNQSDPSDCLQGGQRLATLMTTNVNANATYTAFKEAEGKKRQEEFDKKKKEEEEEKARMKLLLTAKNLQDYAKQSARNKLVEFTKDSDRYAKDIQALDLERKGTLMPAIGPTGPATPPFVQYSRIAEFLSKLNSLDYETKAFIANGERLLGGSPADLKAEIDVVKEGIKQLQTAELDKVAAARAWALGQLDFVSEEWRKIPGDRRALGDVKTQVGLLNGRVTYLEEKAVLESESIEEIRHEIGAVRTMATTSLSTISSSSKTTQPLFGEKKFDVGGPTQSELKLRKSALFQLRRKKDTEIREKRGDLHDSIDDMLRDDRGKPVDQQQFLYLVPYVNVPGIQKECGLLDVWTNQARISESVARVAPLYARMPLPLDLVSSTLEGDDSYKQRLCEAGKLEVRLPLNLYDFNYVPLDEKGQRKSGVLGRPQRLIPHSKAEKIQSSSPDYNQYLRGIPEGFRPYLFPRSQVTSDEEEEEDQQPGLTERTTTRFGKMSVGLRPSVPTLPGTGSPVESLEAQDAALMRAVSTTLAQYLLDVPSDPTVASNKPPRIDVDGFHPGQSTLWQNKQVLMGIHLEDGPAREKFDTRRTADRKLLLESNFDRLDSRVTATDGPSQIATQKSIELAWASHPALFSRWIHDETLYSKGSILKEPEKDPQYVQLMFVMTKYYLETMFGGQVNRDRNEFTDVAGDVNPLRVDTYDSTIFQFFYSRDTSPHKRMAPFTLLSDLTWYNMSSTLRVTADDETKNPGSFQFWLAVDQTLMVFSQLWRAGQASLFRRLLSTAPQIVDYHTLQRQLQDSSGSWNNTSTSTVAKLIRTSLTTSAIEETFFQEIDTDIQNGLRRRVLADESTLFLGVVERVSQDTDTEGLKIVNEIKARRTSSAPTEDEKNLATLLQNRAQELLDLKTRLTEEAKANLEQEKLYLVTRLDKEDHKQNLSVFLVPTTQDSVVIPLTEVTDRLKGLTEGTDDEFDPFDMKISDFAVPFLEFLDNQSELVIDFIERVYQRWQTEGSVIRDKERDMIRFFSQVLDTIIVRLLARQCDTAAYPGRTVPRVLQTRKALLEKLSKQMHRLLKKVSSGYTSFSVSSSSRK